MAKMANVKGKEARSLMENPWPVPSQDPGFALVGSKSQVNSPVHKPMAQPASNPTSAVAIHDPMANEQAANSKKRSKCCRCLKIFSTISTIGLVLGTIVRINLRAHDRELAVPDLTHLVSESYKPVLERSNMESSLASISAASFKVLDAYYHPEKQPDLDPELRDILKQFELSQRQQRDVETSSKKMNLRTRKMKYQQARKFTS